jgi:hypothetical protein
VNAAGGQRLVALAIRAQPPDADHEPFASTSRVDQVNFGDHVRRQLPFSANSAAANLQCNLRISSALEAYYGCIRTFEERSRGAERQARM